MKKKKLVFLQGRTEHEVACHVQEIPENGADIAHLGFLHLAGAPVGKLLPYRKYSSSLVSVIYYSLLVEIFTGEMPIQLKIMYIYNMN